MEIKMSRELMQQALDYIKETYDFCVVMQQPKEREEQLMKSLEVALAQPESAPTADVFKFLLGEGTLEGCEFGVRPLETDGVYWWRKYLRQALAQPEQEPVALKMVYGEVCYQSKHDDQSFGMWCPITEREFPNGTPFYTSPPSKEWVGLTDDERNRYISYTAENFSAGVLWAETKLRERNT